jgi:hypothetical protein
MPKANSVALPFWVFRIRYAKLPYSADERELIPTGKAFVPSGRPKLTLIWAVWTRFPGRFRCSPRGGSSQAIISRALSRFFFTNTTYSVDIGNAALQAGVITK